MSKLRQCRQVAAVCYRLRRGVVEFLLVQTRSRGRWTFPKGSAERGLTHAQAAALEAFEEAGVHGRIQEASFTRYVSRKLNSAGVCDEMDARSSVVSAHLCEVLRLSKPKEANRNRTWFNADAAIRHLRLGRMEEDGREFARVVQLAVSSIDRLRNAPAFFDPPGGLPDAALRKVRFEHASFPEGHRDQESTFYPRKPIRPMRRFVEYTPDSRTRKALRGEVLPFGISRQVVRDVKLLSGAKRLTTPED